MIYRYPRFTAVLLFPKTAVNDSFFTASASLIIFGFKLVAVSVAKPVKPCSARWEGRYATGLTQLSARSASTDLCRLRNC